MISLIRTGKLKSEKFEEHMNKGMGIRPYWYHYSIDHEQPTFYLLSNLVGLQIFSWKSLQANYFCNVIDHPGMAFFHSLFMVCCILCQSLTIYWLGKGGWWISTSRIHQILVDVRPGLNLAEQSWVFREVKSLNRVWGRYRSACLSFTFKRLIFSWCVIQKNWYRFLLLSHICTKRCEKILKC